MPLTNPSDAWDPLDLPPYQRSLQTTNVLTNFLIGASVSLIASCLSSLGLNMQASALKFQRDRNTAVADASFVSEGSGGWGSANTSLDAGYGALGGDHAVGLGGASAASPVDSSAERGNTGLLAVKSSRAGERNKAATATATGSSSSASSASSSSSFATTLRAAKKRIQTQTWREFWHSWQWHIGFSLYLLCQLFGSVIALGFVSPVILAPLGSASLIFNVIFSRLFLGTKIRGLDWLGTFFVVVGCGIVSTFGSGGPETKQTLEDLLRLFTRPAFIIYFSIQGSLVLALFAAIKYLEYGVDALRFFSVVPTRSSPAAVVTTETTPLLARKASQVEVASVKGEWVGALYGVVGGVVASETLILTKSGIELLIVSIFETDKQNRGFFSFGLVAVLCVTVFLQLYSLNRALHYALPTIIIPIFYTFYTILSLFNTLVYFNQFGDYNAPDLVCIAVGMGLIIGGVVGLSYGHEGDLRGEQGGGEGDLVVGVDVGPEFEQGSLSSAASTAAARKREPRRGPGGAS
ncbi:uncharacterized protein EV422DRAFT_546313 [Fimicolochytrium jonesii]|uniref:uncharacterized protein n=1 Tax=Fimicolochytrium jonesii TaxID=1396493 RepID=UPI0022FE9EF2|nr:uncharacterized protein EV422DRAFT_546313 [Fimicolochytrium jonesii]KAI8816329.1 hypothetical protein EV422DRAFT_546313 [Fimicolochytrium jonesii]